MAAALPLVAPVVTTSVCPMPAPPGLVLRGGARRGARRTLDSMLQPFVTAAVAAGAALTVMMGMAGAAALLLSAYLLLLSLAAWRSRRPPVAAAPRTRVVVIVPAHDEAALIGRCVGSLLAQGYPRELFDVVVIADNCTDATASIAAAAGARVLVRHNRERRGKGHALRWALDRLLVKVPVPYAVAVVDADAVADPAFLAVGAGALERGARAVQCEYRLAEDGTGVTALRAAALLLFNCVRPAGRATLGLPAHLSGS